MHAKLFEGQAPHMRDDARGLAAWFTDPLGYVVQIQRPRQIDDAHASFQIRVYGRLMRAVAPSTRILHMGEFLLMTGYTTDARKRLTRWAISTAVSSEAFLCSIPEHNPIVRMGFSVVQAGLSVVGLRLKLVSSVAELLELSGVRAQPKGFASPPT